MAQERLRSQNRVSRVPANTAAMNTRELRDGLTPDVEPAEPSTEAGGGHNASHGHAVFHAGTVSLAGRELRRVCKRRTTWLSKVKEPRA